MVIKGTVYAQAAQVIEPLLGRLQRAGKAPLFLYTHLMEAHAPYDRGSKTGSDHARYLSEVAIADREIGRVQALLEQRFGDRWALFVSADHGEAFGEHQTYEHSKTLYQELVHVPLLAVGPRIPHRVVDQRVGLVDLGPTLLDLFGVDTPASFEGQSLVPLLAGQDVTLTRPLLSEGRLRRALTLPDGLKVIEDPRRKVVEVYDLAADPGETRNLFDLEPARADPALATLRQFFAVHAVTTDGYQPPFEP
jgi:arylsulfatase A-like enzyme